MSFTIIISGIGIVFALGGMAFLIFKKVSPVVVGPLAAILLSLTSELPLLNTVINEYVPGVGNFFVSFFLIFLLGNIFGNLYQITGAAYRIGEITSKAFGVKRLVNCMAACFLSAAALSYGGFAMIFAVYPIALKLFEEADVPTYLMPSIICGGMWTFTMTGPFTPQIQNIISMQNLGTPSYAGLLPGAMASAAMVILMVAYMTWEAKRAKAKGHKFEYPTHIVHADDTKKHPGGLISFIPLFFMIVGFNVTNINIEAWLAMGIILGFALFWKYIPEKKLLEIFNSAAGTAVTIVINTATIVGLGSVIRMTPFYAFAVEVLEASTANPYVVATVGSNVFAAVLGSASGGLALMYSSLRDTFLAYGEQGYNLEYIHRLCSLSSGCLDKMPWNGAIVSVFAICGTTYQKSFRYTFICSAIMPLIATVLIALPICMIFG